MFLDITKVVFFFREKMLISVELKRCVTRFIHFLDPVYE